MNGEKRMIGICGNGSFTRDKFSGDEECMCCTKKFPSGDIVVELFEFGVPCPDCILSGPKGMAANIREKGIPKAIRFAQKHEESLWEIGHLEKIAAMLEKKESITDFPDGIFALKVAEAYRDAKGTGKVA